MNERQEASQPADAGELWTKSFLIITISYFLMFLCLQMLLSPFPTYIKERFHSNDFTTSLVTSLFALSAIATRFATAALIKKHSRSLLLLIGIVIAASATAAYSYADSIAAVLLLRICFGIGFGIGSTIIPTIVSQIIPPRRIGEGIGYFGLSTSLAMSMGPMIGLTMLDSYGFRPLTGVGTAVVLLIIPLLFATGSIPSKPVSSPKRPADEQRENGARYSIGKLVLPAVLNMLMSVTYGGLLSFLALFGKEAHLNNVGLFFLFNVVTVLIVRPISGKIFDSRGHGAVIIPGAVLVTAGLVVLSFAESLPILIASALLYGLGFGAIQPTLQAWMLRESPPEKHGSANSLYYNALDFGVAIGSMLLGTIASVTNYAVMYRYAAGFMGLFLLLYLVVRLMQITAARSVRSNVKGQG